MSLGSRFKAAVDALDSYQERKIREWELREAFHPFISPNEFTRVFGNSEQHKYNAFLKNAQTDGRGFKLDCTLPECRNFLLARILTVPNLDGSGDVSGYDLDIKTVEGSEYFQNFKNHLAQQGLLVKVLSTEAPIFARFRENGSMTIAIAKTEAEIDALKNNNSRPVKFGGVRFGKDPVYKLEEVKPASP